MQAVMTKRLRLSRTHVVAVGRGSTMLEIEHHIMPSIELGVMHA